MSLGRSKPISLVPYPGEETLLRYNVKRAFLAIAGGLILWCTGSVSHQAYGTESPKQVGPYGKEIIRQGDVVTVSKTFVDAVKRDNALVLLGVAIRQRMNKDGALEACELVEIDRGSPAARVGLRPGDRLTRVNGFPIRELEMRRADLEGSRRWELGVLRRGKSLRIVVEARE